MNKEDLLLEQWKMASELHRHEDELTWQRFSYFVTLTGILASGLGLVWTTSSMSATSFKVISIAISTFGVVISLVWSLIFKRAYMYHLYRAAQAKEAEQALQVNNERVLTLYEKGLKEQKLVRVSIFARFPTNDLIFFLALFVTLSWIILLVSFAFLI